MYLSKAVDRSRQENSTDGIRTTILVSFATSSPRDVGVGVVAFAFVCRDEVFQHVGRIGSFENDLDPAEERP